MPKTTAIATTSAVAPSTMRPPPENIRSGGFVCETSAGLVSIALAVSVAIALLSSDFIAISPRLNMNWLSFPLGLYGLISFWALLMQQAEHGRYKDQCGNRGTEQTPDDGAPERCILLASVAEAKRHGDHANNHGECRHQNWPEARVTCFDCGFDRVPMVQQAFFGERDNQNAGRSGDAHAHDRSHQCGHAEGCMCDEQKEKNPCQRARQRGNDDEGIEP